MSQRDKLLEKVAAPAPSVPSEVSKRSYKPPRVLWVEPLQTLAYECGGGPSPGSGLGCPV